MSEDFYATLIRTKFIRMLEAYHGMNMDNERKREQIQQELAREFRLTKEDIAKILTVEGVFPQQSSPKERRR